MPGVQSAALVSALPLEGETWIDIVGTEHDPRPLTGEAFHQCAVHQPRVLPDAAHCAARGPRFRRAGPRPQGHHHLRRFGAAGYGPGRAHWAASSTTATANPHGGGRRHRGHPQHQPRPRPGQHDVHSLLAAGAASRFAAGAHRHGPTRNRGGAAQRHLGRRFRGAHTGSAHAGSGDGAIGGPAPVPGDAGGAVCRRRAGAGGLRNLRRGLLRGGPPPGGDGNPHGAGRDNEAMS